MLGDTMEWLRSALGVGEGDLEIHEMALRAVLIYVAALVMVRMGEKRFLGKSAAFDVILAVILGSVVSRAITGQSPLVPTVIAGFVLVGMHWLLAEIAFRSEAFADAVKGGTRVLVEDGRIDWDAMRRSDVGENDLLAALRLSGVLGPEKVRQARLERNGDISVIKAEPEPRILHAALQGTDLTVTLKLRP